MNRPKFKKGDLVLILIPEPNVSNYEYHHFNYQLGIVMSDIKCHTCTVCSVDVMLDFQQGLFEEFQLIIGMYIDHLIKISPSEFA